MINSYCNKSKSRFVDYIASAILAHVTIDVNNVSEYKNKILTLQNS